MIKDIIFHDLKGINGLSFLKIDIACVMDISYKKRLFKIFDQEYPYTLTVEYDMSKTTFYA